MRAFMPGAVAAIILALAAPSSLLAQEDPSQVTDPVAELPLRARAETVVSLINGEIEPDAIFTQGFLRAVPPERFKTIARQLTEQFGAAVSVENLTPRSSTRAILVVRMERAIATGAIAIDPLSENRVSELLFQSFAPTSDSLASIEADLAALEGQVSWWFGPLDEALPPVTSSKPDRQMPIGSTFKLYVLATLARDIAEGRRSWSDRVTIGDKRSFPSGMMQDWPANAPVTLHTLASLMISISDNTATDVLIDELGRDAILRTLVESGHSQPSLNDPFLKTREMFLLKAGPEGRLRTYIRSDSDVRGQILEGIDDPTLPRSQIEIAFSGTPIALEVEWFASADDIVKLLRFMRETAHPEAFSIMNINPSLPAQLGENWGYIGYKGGSEPGVLNLTWLFQDAEGKDHALILSWRNDQIRFDPSALELLAQRLLAPNL